MYMYKGVPDPPLTHTLANLPLTQTFLLLLPPYISRHLSSFTLTIQPASTCNHIFINLSSKEGD